jgi:hypothetical protein
MESSKFQFGSCEGQAIQRGSLKELHKNFIERTSLKLCLVMGGQFKEAH